MNIDINSMSAKMAELLPLWGGRLVGALVGLVLAFMVAGMIRSAVTRALTRAKVDLTLTKFIAKMARWAVLAAALVAILGIFGIETTSFAALIGAAGLAIGLGFQGTLGSLAAGVMLLIFRPFKVGDVITVSGVTAKVNAIDLFVTTFDTGDNRRIIMPNKAVFGSTIENTTYHDTRRVDVNVGTDYGADLDQVREVLMKAAKSIELGLEDPAPAVVLNQLGGSSIDWTMRLWAKTGDYWPVKDALTVAVKKELDAAGIGIPFPQMDVHLDGGLDKAA